MHLLTFFTLWFAFVAAVPTASSGPSRIVGGHPIIIDQYPSMARITTYELLGIFSHACGGSILNSRTLLTAAQCMSTTTGILQPSRVRGRVGSTLANSGGIVYNSASFTVHPNYNSRTLDCDIAVIRVSGTIVFNALTQPTSIAGADYILGDNQVVWATGWGATSDGLLAQEVEQLHHVQMWTVNQTECAQHYGVNRITANMMCAGWPYVGRRGQCKGDEGAPLYHNNVQVGVYSFSNGCAQPFHPSINTRVSRFASWIQSLM